MYTVQNIYEDDEKLESELISGKADPANNKQAREEEEGSSEPLDLDDLMDEMQDAINLE